MKNIYILLLCAAAVFSLSLYACESEKEPDPEDFELLLTADEIPDETTEPEITEDEYIYAEPEEEPEAAAEEAPDNTDEIVILDLSDIHPEQYFIIDTPGGEEFILYETGITTLPEGGFVTLTENGFQFEVDRGGTIEYDAANAPHVLYITNSFRLLSPDGRDIIIESPERIAVIIDGLEPDSRLRDSPWRISFDRDRNAVFGFDSSEIKFISLASVFPMYKDTQNGTVLFQNCLIELPDGTIIEAPRNTRAVVEDGRFEVILGTGSAVVKNPDGTTRAIPGGTVLDGNFEIVA
ncbi:MAG: hypothetical protein FWH24_03660 [Oscillospiraceae bacterium]|nr:hypothetical protein [Oscillospiraceae bacterium]